MTKHERRHSSYEVRMDEEGRTVMGVAAPYYDGTGGTEYQLPGFDGAVERYMPGAFDDAIQRDDVRALFNHDASLILGRSRAGTLRLESKPDGLHYTITLGDTSVAKDVREHIKRGDVTGSSAGWIATKDEWRRDGGVAVREIHEAKLFDVSPVTFPAYQDTEVSVRMESFKQFIAKHDDLSYWFARLALADAMG